MPARSPDRGAQPLRIDPEVPDLLAIDQHHRNQFTVALGEVVVGVHVDFFPGHALRLAHGSYHPAGVLAQMTTGSAE